MCPLPHQNFYNLCSTMVIPVSRTLQTPRGPHKQGYLPAKLPSKIYTATDWGKERKEERGSVRADFMEFSPSLNVHSFTSFSPLCIDLHIQYDIRVSCCIHGLPVILPPCRPFPPSLFPPLMPPKSKPTNLLRPICPPDHRECKSCHLFRSLTNAWWKKNGRLDSWCSHCRNAPGMKDRACTSCKTEKPLTTDHWTLEDDGSWKTDELTCIPCSRKRHLSTAACQKELAEETARRESVNLDIPVIPDGEDRLRTSTSDVTF
jgi:hypothetical protein